jgi:hypothetical protein
MSVVPGEEHDGPPPGGLESAVDARGLRVDGRREFLVTGQAIPTRCGDLDEGEPPDRLGPPLEVPLDTLEALDDAFRVIDAIDAHAERLGCHAERGQQLRARAVWGGRAGVRSDPERDDGNRRT